MDSRGAHAPRPATQFDLKSMAEHEHELAEAIEPHVVANEAADAPREKERAAGTPEEPDKPQPALYWERVRGGPRGARGDSDAAGR